MQNFNLEEIFLHAKLNSPYYKKLYHNINFTKFTKLNDLPIVDQFEFWNSTVITEDLPTGMIFKSGGSTGSPKYSYFTNAEWQTFTQHFGSGIAKGIIADGDRVANLFYAGDLYASFLFINASLQSIDINEKKILQFPITGQTDPHEVLKILNEFKINVLIGVPTSIFKLLKTYHSNIHLYPQIKIDKILFGGESMYEDQKNELMEIFPQLKISSVGYASVDGGLLGYSSTTCKNGEHFVFEGANIIEIIDPDTNELILEKNRPGKVLLTNLTRKLMPIIRYPAGDLATWVEVGKIFKLQGRSEEAARLGTISVYYDDFRELILNKLKGDFHLSFQMILKHFEHKDCLMIKISGVPSLHYSELRTKILEAFMKEKPAYLELLNLNLIHPLQIEFVEFNEFETNGRTGKIKRIIDQR